MIDGSAALGTPSAGEITLMRISDGGFSAFQLNDWHILQ